MTYSPMHRNIGYPFKFNDKTTLSIKAISSSESQSGNYGTNQKNQPSVEVLKLYASDIESKIID